jgi:hypothetical protein
MSDPFERWDIVLVVDAEDQYVGEEGVVTGFEVGMVSGRDMAVVQLCGRDRADVEGFYVEQLELAA